MEIITYCWNAVPQGAIDTFHWASNSYHSLGKVFTCARQKTHNVFRSFLLTCLSYLEKNEPKTFLMGKVAQLKRETGEHFRSTSCQTKAKELATMISALSARVLLDAEEERKKIWKETSGFFFKTRSVFFTMLRWLEPRDPTHTTSQQIEEIKSAKEELDKKMNETTWNIDGTIIELKSQSEVTTSVTHVQESTAPEHQEPSEQSGEEHPHD